MAAQGCLEKGTCDPGDTQTRDTHTDTCTFTQQAHMEPHTHSYTHRASSSFRDTHVDSVIDTYTPHADSYSGTRGCALPRPRHTPSADVHKYEHTHTNSLMLPDEDTDVWSKTLQTHRTQTRTYGMNPWKPDSQRTEKHASTRMLMDPSDIGTHPSVTNRPTTPPFICSRNICGASTACQDSSGWGHGSE